MPRNGLLPLALLTLLICTPAVSQTSHDSHHAAQGSHGTVHRHIARQRLQPPVLDLDSAAAHRDLGKGEILDHSTSQGPGHCLKPPARGERRLAQRMQFPHRIEGTL